MGSIATKLRGEKHSVLSVQGFVENRKEEKKRKKKGCNCYNVLSNDGRSFDVKSLSISFNRQIKEEKLCLFTLFYQSKGVFITFKKDSTNDKRNGTAKLN